MGNRSILAHPGWPGMQDLIHRTDMDALVPGLFVTEKRKA